jgi:hypothetical protein
VVVVAFFFALRVLSRFLSLSLLRNNKKKGSVTAEKAKKKREEADISE